jgi:hypothetical protein
VFVLVHMVRRRWLPDADRLPDQLTLLA